MKLCIDCKHYRPKKIISDGLWFYHEIEQSCCRPIGISPVDGKPMLKYADPSTERDSQFIESSSKCCPDAVFFEQKEETK